MRGKIYDRNELDRALPLVRSIVTEITEGYAWLRANLFELGLSGPDKDGGVMERDLPWDLRDLVDEIRSCIDELAELGVLLRDPETGLVEAYGERDGEIIFFSWKPGEEGVRFWHRLFNRSEERLPVEALV
jgi:hypothetical protein